MGTLILSRRINETLCIGDDVRIIVLSVRGNQVRLGITAPKSIPVHRAEVYARIKGATEARCVETNEGGVIQEDPTVVVVANSRRGRLARMA